MRTFYEEWSVINVAENEAENDADNLAHACAKLPMILKQRRAMMAKKIHKYYESL